MALSNTSMFVIAGLICAASVVLIVSAPDEGMLDYIYVDTVVDDPGEYTGRDIQIHGLVVTDSLEQDESSGDYHFTVEYKGRRLAVVFDGQLPDTFAEGGEVVATGRLDDDGRVFRSSEMSAKCPSKYEEEPGAAPAARS
ncbi:cytochrome c maturation protein CcmE [Nannocystaceae bacterium ST9]